MVAPLLMNQTIALPPIFSVVTLAADADVLAEAKRLAAAGADDGTLVWADKDDLLDCAVILHPETGRDELGQLVYVAMLGLGDAMGRAAPPMLELTYSWPNRIMANGGVAARIGLAVPEDSVKAPAWLIIHASVNIDIPLPEAWDVDNPITSLKSLGFEDITATGLLENYSRHLLTWVNRWEDDGFGPVHSQWLNHVPNRGEPLEIEIGGKRITGVFRDISDDGALVMEAEGKLRTIDLATAFSATGVITGPQSDR
ncbi:MAG: biotin/lipoate--protein ligase family protein [Alphaproteobacteria bacterium]